MAGRRRDQAIALGVILAASALEAYAAAAGVESMRDLLLVLIAATMAVAAIRG